MTGQEFSNILDLRIDKAYSAFLTNTEKNRLAKEALIKQVQLIYKNLQTQDERDKIYSLIKSNQIFVPVNDKIFLNSSGIPNIPDYMDLFTVKAKFTDSIIGLTVKDASNTSPIVIKVSGQNNLRSQEQITFAGINGNFAANGTFFIKQISSFKVALYSDSNLTIPVSGNGTYINGGIIGRVFYKYCLQLTAQRKIDPYSAATVRVPRFEIADKSIKIYPSGCQEITVDYLKNPDIFIDVTNNSIDLEKTYQINFLYDIANETANLFAQAFKDGELFQTSNIEGQKNNLL